MWRIEYLGKDGSSTEGVVEYPTADEAWRAIHEQLEEAFGDNYGKPELKHYRVVGEPEERPARSHRRHEHLDDDETNLACERQEAEWRSAFDL